MDAALTSLADARNAMVDSQLRPNKVTDRRIIEAMRHLPRERFVPPAQRALAYADAEIPIGHGRVVLAPLAVARLVQAAATPAGARVLVLGAGYAAALFAAIGSRVTVLEQDPAVAAQAAAALAECGVLAIVHGAFASGWPAEAPYDVIFIDGAVAMLPDLAAQLRDNPPGRLCAIVMQHEHGGIAVLAERAGPGLVHRPLFDCTASLMPQFPRSMAFRF